MPRCKKEVLELIDQALKCELLDFCGCQIITGGSLWVCEGCRIKKALRVARYCIVTGVEGAALFDVELIGVQDAIEDKLKAFLDDGELREEEGDPDG